MIYVNRLINSGVPHVACCSLKLNLVYVTHEPSINGHGPVGRVS